MNTILKYKDQILNVWNNTDRSYSDSKTLHQIFEERAALQPNRTALVSSEKNVSYSELNSKANQVTRALKSYGVTPHSFVGILLPRSPEMIVTLYALLKYGSAYVPLNITDPVERILKITQTANIEYIITFNEFEDDFKGTGKKIILLDDLIEKSDTLSSDNLDNNISADDPAYIIFTSGTTGTPKGVLVKHRPVINLIEWVNNTFNINNTDKLIWTTNLSFDLSVYDIFGILAAGGTLRILNDMERLNPEKQLKIMLEENITFWDSAPQNLQMVIPFLSEYVNKLKDTSLRLVFLSGDWIPLMLPNEIKSLFKKAQVVGLGGATEATIWSNYFIINHIDPKWKSIPYGKPIQNAKYYVLDSNLEHCEILTPGDLYIGGQCLASGYYNDQELTSKKFIDDPYNKGGKLYFTGDKAQWMPDGNIEFLGRDDLQVKIRGYRVELSEIKHAALSVTGIKDCVVVSDKSDLQNIKIYLFYISHNHKELDNEILERDLSRLLPNYMMPSGSFAIDRFPMTSNGKVDNKALLEIASKSRQIQPKAGNEILSLTEKETLSIWCDILKRKDILTTDNFFEIGGNSLLTIVMTSKIEKKFNVDFNIRNIFGTPRIKDLAELIDIKMNLKNSGKDQVDNTVAMAEGEI